MDRSHILAAIAAVAAMIACAFAPMASAADVTEYGIDMRVGDTFSYSPTTNLPAAFDSAPDIAGVSWDASKRTMTASFDTAKPNGVQVLVLAHWTSSDGSISQDAKQAINFRVYSHLTVSCDSAAAVPVGTEAGSVVLKPEVSAAEDGTKTVVTCDLKENPYIAWDSSKNAVVTKADITSADSEEYAFAITAVNSSTDSKSTLRPETVAVAVKVFVGSPITITGSDLETYIGCDDSRNTWTLKTSLDGRTDVEMVKSILAPDDAPEGLVVSNEDGVLVIDPSKAVLGTADAKTYTFTAKVSAVIDDEPFEAEREFSVIVWKDLTFLTTPSIADVQLMPDSTDARKVILSASVTKASAVTVDWGDGEPVERVSVADGKITASKTYDDGGRHVIAVTAVNGTGTATHHYVLYDASTGYFEEYKPTKEKDAVSAIWLIFLALAGLFTAMYFVFGYRHPIVLIGAIVSAALAAVFCAGWL